MSTVRNLRRAAVVAAATTALVPRAAFVAVAAITVLIPRAALGVAAAITALALSGCDDPAGGEVRR